MKSFNDLLSKSLEGKVVFVRVDFNTPIKNGQVTDNTRIKASLETINSLSEKGAKVVIIAHLDRPGGKIIEELRLNPIQNDLETLLKKSIIKLDECIGPNVKSIINKMNNSDIILLENIRFYIEETRNDKEFSKEMASYADYFVQDAFGTVHRQHASTYGIPNLLPSYPGRLLDKEIKYMSQILNQPKRPFIGIIGGSKISTKLSFLEHLLNNVDTIILGGAMVYTILKAQGFNIGKSLVEDKSLTNALSFLKKASDLNKTVYIPEDHMVVTSINNPESLQTIASNEFNNNHIGVDIGPKSINKIKTIINTSNTIFWNGPFGIFEKKPYAAGTNALALAIANASALTIVGGGDSIAALNASGHNKKIDHISTGGGASLEFLSGHHLPGIEVLK